jgi:antimicrobial peptide system SdpB family protein
MLNGALARLGRQARDSLAIPVWSSGVGLARSVLALGTAATIAATDPAMLMSPLANGVTPPVCSSVAKAGLWCVLPGNLAVCRWVSVAVLLVVASGWRPRLTAIPHWWISWSLLVNATVIDGGDQITGVLTLLLLPIALTDPRRWHWWAVDRTSEPGVRHVVAHAALRLIQLQVCLLYFQASVAKLGVREWADGTAMYYWSRDPTFGSASWLNPVTDLVTGSPVGVATLSWGAVAFEFSLATAIVLRPPLRRVLLIAGVAFHAMIALDMGLVSFFMAMSGALLLYLLPVGHQMRWPRRTRPSAAYTTATALGRTIEWRDHLVDTLPLGPGPPETAG